MLYTKNIKYLLIFYNLINTLLLYIFELNNYYLFIFQSGDIEILTKTNVESIDTKAKIVNLSNSEQISFDAMFIASGMTYVFV